MKLLKFILTKSFWIQLAIILGLTAIAVLLVFQWLSIHTNHNNYITLNDLSGLTLDQAVDQLEDRNLRYALIDSNTFSDTLLPKSITKQDPKPNAKVKDGRTVYLWVNASKPPMVEVPELAGKKSFDMALQALKNRGLELGEVTYRPSEEENSILEVKIDGEKVTKNMQVRRGTVVDLIVGGGTSNTKVDLDCFIGMTLETASFIISASDLNIGFTKYDTIGLIDSSSAVIYKQLPSCNESVIKIGESIDLFLAQELPADVLNNMPKDTLSNQDNLNPIEIE